MSLSPANHSGGVLSSSGWLGQSALGELYEPELRSSSTETYAKRREGRRGSSPKLGGRLCAVERIDPRSQNPQNSGKGRSTTSVEMRDEGLRCKSQAQDEFMDHKDSDMKEDTIVAFFLAFVASFSSGWSMSSGAGGCGGGGGGGRETARTAGG